MGALWSNQSYHPIHPASFCSYQSCYVAKVGWHHRQVASSKAKTISVSISQMLSCTLRDNLEFQIHQTYKRTQENPERTSRHRENIDTPHGKAPGLESYLRPSCCEATPLTTVSPRFASFRRDHDITLFIYNFNKYFYNI